MARYLMTHSLLAAWTYALKENPYEDLTTDRDPVADFMRTLRRESIPPTEAMQNGIIFEDLVSAILRGEQTFGYFEMHDQDGLKGSFPAEIREHRWYDAAAKIAGRVRGGVPQYKVNKAVEVGGLTLVLHGRLDWLKAGEIVDIKFTKNYDPGKFYDSTQHPMYFELVPEAQQFTYLASNGSAVWPETYRRDETRSIIPDILDFFDWLRAVDLMALYQQMWEAK